MSRAADYTIKGFLYQFNKSLIEILDAPEDGEITLEGIVEDVEVITVEGVTAIQCKYHEAAECFTPSSIYKPLLQMMVHFHDNHTAPVRYVLFSHYPGENKTPIRKVLNQYVKGALGSKNSELTKLTEILLGKVNVKDFLAKFSMEFGPPLETLVKDVHIALERSGILKDDIETIAYPNAIHIVATMSAKHKVSERRIKKIEFIETLKNIRKTAISRWTLALGTRKKILEAKRKELKGHLNLNSRTRCFVIDIDRLENHIDGFISFAKDFLDKYHFKVAHISTPIFCVRATLEDFNEIRVRLFQKGIIASDGFTADHFDKSRLFREPICSRNHGGLKREFSMRILRWEDHAILLKEQKLDDLFIVGESNLIPLVQVGVEVERLAVTSHKELKYLMGVSDVHD